MTTIVKTRLIKIGNSQGIRIPKLLLEQVGLQDEVQVQVEADHLILRAAAVPRQGWEEQFLRMAVHEDDRLLDADALPPTEWEDTEWNW